MDIPKEKRETAYFEHDGHLHNKDQLKIATDYISSIFRDKIESRDDC